MDYSRIKVFPGSFGLGGLDEVFSDIFFNIGEVMSCMPQGIICGELPPTNILADNNDNLVIQLAVAGYPDEGITISYKDEYERTEGFTQ